MNTSDTRLQVLASQVEGLSHFLGETGQTSWANTLRDDASVLRAGERIGCANFLSHFGGAGSLNDIMVGNAQTNAQFEALCSSAKALARAEYPSLLSQLGPVARTTVCVLAAALVLVLLLTLAR